MKKIAIVMTYFDRQLQLNNTLDSIAESNYKNFEIIIVDDGSPDDIVLKKYPFKITVRKITNKPWIAGVPAFNAGIALALQNDADIIAIQNAECVHVGDIMSHAAKHCDDSNYVAFGCFSIDEQHTFAGVRNNGDLMALINGNNFGASRNGQNAWYNHPIHRPCAYHFCSAITRKNMIAINGFDERFANGNGFDDDDLIRRIRQLGLKIEITDHPFVIHQWHYTQPEHPLHAKRVERNRYLYRTLMADGGTRAEHVFTDNFFHTT